MIICQSTIYWDSLLTNTLIRQSLVMDWPDLDIFFYKGNKGFPIQLELEEECSSGAHGTKLLRLRPSLIFIDGIINKLQIKT